MALSQRLEFRQTQGLVMTPQLMQAIKLLQLSSLDLAAYVDGELERNPLLERVSDEDQPVSGTETNNPIPESGDDGSGTADWMGADLETSRSSMEQGLGTELENVFRALKKSFCAYSYNEPWKVLDPLLLIWLKTAPPTPYCAEKVDVDICTSAMSSKTMTSTLALWGSVVLAPSARKFE